MRPRGNDNNELLLVTILAMLFILLMVMGLLKA